MGRGAESPVDVLVSGVGTLGEWAVEFLARTPDVRSIAVADVQRERGETICYRAALGALQEGCAPRIAFYQHDLKNAEATAELLRRLRPRVILHTATLLALPTLVARMAPERFAELKQAGYGGLLPLHVVLTRNVMRATQQMDEPADVIDAPFPDYVNPLLASRGLAPLAGCGNVDNVATEVRLGVARERGVDPRDVQVHLIASHAIVEAFRRPDGPGDMPYECRVAVAGRDISNQVDVAGILRKTARTLLAGGLRLEARVASSGVKQVLTLLREAPLQAHAPGPAGLQGGYPVRLRRGEAEIDLPPDISLDQARAINRAGLARSGIERIDPDGTVTTTERAAEVFKQVLGYDARRFAVDEADARADELLGRLRELYVR